MKKTRLVLVEFPWGRDKDPRVPLGHASMLAMVTNLPNVSCKSFVRPINSSNFNVESIKHEILYELTKSGEDADIAFGVYVWCEDVIKSILAFLRANNYHGRIILGGPQISYSESGLETVYPEADIFVRGYGEFAIAALMTNQNKINHTGVHYAGDVDKLEQTVVDLDLCPSPWLEGIIEVENQNLFAGKLKEVVSLSAVFVNIKRQVLDCPSILFTSTELSRKSIYFVKKRFQT